MIDDNAMNDKKNQSTHSADIMGIAMLDYVRKQPWENIRTWTSVGGEDELPLPYLFRSYQEMPELEQKALQLARGSVLDIGCGSGCHALWLQDQGIEVKAIDISQGAIETCRLQGVAKAEVQNIFDVSGETYDTLLLLMNGMGICSKLETLPDLLSHLKGLLKPGGQILADSSDIIYMYDTEEDIDENQEYVQIIPQDHYYGEVIFQTFYKDLSGNCFPWLYVDFFNLQLHASQVGLKCEMLIQGDHFDYLARLSLA